MHERSYPICGHGCVGSRGQREVSTASCCQRRSTRKAKSRLEWRWQKEGTIWFKGTEHPYFLSWSKWVSLSLIVRPLRVCGMHWKPFMKEHMMLNNKILTLLFNNMSFFAWRKVNPSPPCKWDSLILWTNCKTLVRTFQTKIALIKFILRCMTREW